MTRRALPIISRRVKGSITSPRFGRGQNIRLLHVSLPLAGFQKFHLKTAPSAISNGTAIHPVNRGGDLRTRACLAFMQRFAGKAEKAAQESGRPRVTASFAN